MPSKADLLKTAFTSIGFPLEDAELLSNCNTLCSLYSLSPEALASKWEVYAINNKLDKMSMEIIPKWKASLGKLHQQFQTKKEVKDKTYNASNVSVLDDIDASAFGVSDDVPLAAKKRRFKVDLPTDEEDDTTAKIDHNALLKKARMENATNPKGNAHVATNGHSVDDSHSTNGHSNGHANGHSNGHVTNGNSNANGTSNGVVNGHHANGHHVNGNTNNVVNGSNEDADKKATRFIPVLDDVWSSSQEDADASFALRPNPGKVEVTFQPTIKPLDDVEYDMWEDTERTVKITIEPNSEIQTYRFMGEDMERNAAVMDDRLVTLGNRIQEEHMLPRPEMFHIPAQDPVVAMGRICSDNDQVFGDKSVVLESDEERTKARVALDFKFFSANSEKGFSVFPGQVVIVEGVNTNGKSITVTDFYEPKSMPLYKNPSSYVAPRAHPYAPLTILVAAGPFTTTENLAYRPLDHLLEVVERTNPQVVVLVGPFVDTAQNLVKTSDETFTELFKSKVATTLSRFTANLSTMALPASKLILVPHPRDPEMSPIPQPPFEKMKELESKWITPVANPCTMRVNDVTVGVASADIIRHLASSEVSKNVQGDRMTRLCGHLLKQRSYYPLHPASTEVSIETSKIQALDLPYAPDLLVVPSDLQHFVKNVNDTICINPGRLSKGKTGGTYAKVTVFPQEKKKEREEGEGEGEKEKKGNEGGEAVRVAHRTKVEIVRI